MNKVALVTGGTSGIGKEIVKELKDFLEANPQLVAVSAPQLGINKRIFCIRFKIK